MVSFVDQSATGNIIQHLEKEKPKLFMITLTPPVWSLPIKLLEVIEIDVD